jgi:hypothetical protein
MTILVLTRPDDGTAGGVVAELERRGVAVVRGDVGDFPLDGTMVASLAGHHEWSGSLSLAGQRVGLDEVRAIYYRRPTGFRLPDHLSPEHQRFAKAEARRGLGGLLLTLPVRWVSHPSRVADASSNRSSSSSLRNADCEYLAHCSPTMRRASGSSLSSCPGQ